MSTSTLNQILLICRILAATIAAMLGALTARRIIRSQGDSYRHLLWLVYWEALFAQFFISLNTPFHERQTFVFSFTETFIDTVQSVFLLLLANDFVAAKRLRVFTASGVSALLVIITIAARINPDSLFVTIAESVAGALSFTVVAIVWVWLASPAPRSFLSFLLFLPAAHYIYYASFYRSPLRINVGNVVAVIAILPAFVALAAVCIIGSKPPEDRRRARPGRRVSDRIQINEVSPIATEANVERKLTYNGFYAFLYDARNKPEGKFIIAGITALLFALSTAFVAIIPALLHLRK